MIRISVPLSSAPQRNDRRLLAELKRLYPEFSRAKLDHLLESGRIELENTVDRGGTAMPLPASTEKWLRASSQRAFDVAFALDEDALEALLSPHAAASPEGCPYPVLFENEAILALAKPAGVPSVPHASEETTTMVNAALALRPDLADVSLPLEAGLLHRLDTDTSGALLFAKSPEAYREWRTRWKTARVSKTYRAICAAPGDDRSFSLPLPISTPLGHSAKSDRKMLAIEDAERDGKRIRGKPLEAKSIIRAVTPFRGAEGLGLAGGAEFWDIEIEILTGVQHQIRVHLASIGLPILGDALYRGKKSTRMWLHAWKVALRGDDGKTATIQAPLPADWPASLSEGR